MCVEGLYILSAIFFLRIPAVQCGGSVSYSSAQVCGLKGASVVLPCSYHYSLIGHYMGGEWKEKKRGRVREVSNADNYPDCSLNTNKLTEQHSGVYHFQFYTFLHKSWITSTSGVTLSVTDVQVKEEAVVGNQNQTKLTCSTSCSLGYQYVWYKNGQQLQDKTREIILDSTRPSEVANYSCAVRGYEALRSPVLCVPSTRCWSVTYPSTWVCGLKGTSVVLPCRYGYPEKDMYQRGEWYEKQQERVSQHSNSRYPDCSLSIDNLSDNDAGVYTFRFQTTLHKTWVTVSSGVTLSVRDLEVKEDTVLRNQNQTKLTCSTSCSLGSLLQYVWYKNGQQLQDKTTEFIVLDSSRPSEEGSYSCAVRGHEAHRSTAVCAPAEQCWSVTYSSSSLCVLEGSSVDISCVYKSPRDRNITTKFWFKNKKTSFDKDYEKHTEDLGNENRSSTLKFKDIRQSHSGEYGFVYFTEQGENYTRLPGVNITVTALQVFLPRGVMKEGENMTIICHATCNLSYNPTFTWYKNGQPMTDKHTTKDNKLDLNPVSSEDAGSYSCAVKGHENLTSTTVFLNVTYKPRSVSVSVSPGEIEEGSSVTLTCSSDANPPVHTYTWYMRSGAESLVRGTGENISFSVTSETSGLYYCEARNELGSQRSSEIAVPSKGSDSVAMVLPAIITFIIVAVLLILAIVYLRKNNAEIAAHGRATNANMESDPGLLYSNLTARATTSDLTQRVVSSCDDDDVQYASVQISRSKRQKVPLYSTVKRPQTSAQDDNVVYASVQLNKVISATRVENDDMIYSTVNKPSQALDVANHK